MAFQPVPPQTDLQGLVPAGRMAIALRPFTNPVPCFGPGSVEYTRKKAMELELLERDKDVVVSADEEYSGVTTTALSKTETNNYSTDRPYY